MANARGSNSDKSKSSKRGFGAMDSEKQKMAAQKGGQTGQSNQGRQSNQHNP